MQNKSVILIVDDEVNYRTVTKNILELNEYQVSEAGNLALEPQIAASGDTAFVTWRDFAGTIFDDILFRTATLACPCISFDKTDYKDSETAVITVEDSTKI